MSLTNSDNYRSIATSSIFLEILHKIALSRFDELQNLDLQFGFKPKHLTPQHTFVLQEVIYFRGNHSNFFLTK